MSAPANILYDNFKYYIFEITRANELNTYQEV